MQAQKFTNSAYSRFEYAIKSQETKRKYVRRLELFLNFCEFEGQTLNEKAENFQKFAKENDPEKTTDLILKYMLGHIQRAAKKIISKSTVRNFYKPIKLFCDMNSISFNSRVITRGIPSGSESSNDRIPSRQEILEMLKYPDRRLKPITYTMINSGIITEGRHQVVPVEQEVTWELVNGNPVEHVKSVNGSPVTRHTIEFSKENVDKIIKKHNMQDRKDEILYYWKSNPGQGGFRCNEYSYQQFTESEYEHLKWLYERIGGPTGKTNLAKESPPYADCSCSECAKGAKKKHDKTGRGVQ